MLGDEFDVLTTVTHFFATVSADFIPRGGEKVQLIAETVPGIRYITAEFTEFYCIFLPILLAVISRHSSVQIIINNTIGWHISAPSGS